MSTKAFVYYSACGIPLLHTVAGTEADCKAKVVYYASNGQVLIDALADDLEPLYARSAEVGGLVLPIRITKDLN